MKCVVFFLAVAQLFLQVKAYTYCSYRYYDSYSLRYRTRYYSCSSNQYCCGTSSCCTRVYARWYLWFVLTSFFLVMFIIWWYYRYRYRPRNAVIVARQAQPVVAATTVTTHQTTAAGQPAQPYPYPGYGMYPGGNAAPFQPYNKQGGPPQGYPPPQAQGYPPFQGYAPPPSYSAATGGSGPAYPPPQ